MVPNGFPDTDDNYIVMEYIVENRTGLDLGETYLGSFYDIDINDYRENQTGWLKNSTNNQNIAYTRDSNLSGTEWLSYIGVHSINDDMYMSRYKSSNDPSSTTEMIEIMKDKSENKPSSSDENGDYRMIMSKKLTSFNNGQKDTLLFAILAGDGTANLYYQKANTLISNMNTYGGKVEFIELSYLEERTKNDEYKLLTRYQLTGSEYEIDDETKGVNVVSDSHKFPMPRDLRAEGNTKFKLRFVDER